MPLFRRHEQKAELGDQPSPPATRILSQNDIFDRIEEEISRAQRHGRFLSVLCVLPQRLPGEEPEPRETTLAADVVSAELRLQDCLGRLDDETLVVVLPETSADAARVIAHRVVSDLAIRGGGLGHAKWFVGASSFSDDSADPPEVVSIALRRARR